MTEAPHEDVDQVTVLVDGPPEILPSALNIHEQLVQIPGVTHAPSSAPQPPSVVGLKRVLSSLETRVGPAAMSVIAETVRAGWPVHVMSARVRSRWPESDHSLV